MTVVVDYQTNNGEIGSLSTSSSVIVLDKNTLLLDGGVRINLSFDITLAVKNQTEILYLDGAYATRNYSSNKLIKDYIDNLNTRLNIKTNEVVLK